MLGFIEKSEQCFRRAINIHSEYFEAHTNLGNVLKEQGKLDQAIVSYQYALNINPDSADAYQNLGDALRENGKLEESIAAYQTVLQIQPSNAAAHNNIGIALKRQGKLDAAISAYKDALKINSNFADAYNNIGNIFNEQKKFDAAIASYEKTLRIEPDHAGAHYNMGIALEAQDQLDDAIVSYHNVLKIQPDSADALNNLGNALKKRGLLEEAITAFQKAINIRPNFSGAHYNMGLTLMEQHDLTAAIASYQQAFKIKPDYAEAYCGIGLVLNAQQELAAAIASHQLALLIKPDYAEALINVGNAFQEQGNLDQAIAAYQKALKIKPDDPLAQSQMLHQLQHICDFERTTALSELSVTLGIETAAVSPFAALSWADNSEQQLARSRNWAIEKYKLETLPLPECTQLRAARLKVGYFSADFHDHATMHLIAGLLRSHDPTKFDITAYSYGRSKLGELRKRAEEDVDHFFDITDLSDRAIVDLARTHRLDVVVDLKGYTAQSRSGIFQYRLAPIQINFLGYPGSLGADFIDYIIADPVVIPQDQGQFYSEKVIYLPHSYQPNDGAREIAQTTTTRADFGLPEEGFVFCCFNNSYKINQRQFDIWMRLLSKVEGSVLWLLKANKWAVQNLRKEAEQRGIDPLRLVFADRMLQSEHLARHKHADLFIDTFNYNAHTTASDALWAGLPVVTKQGKQFAARVAASLLTAVGLPELITQNETEYEALILDLATSPHKLQALREKLAINRLTQPLFDTKRYTRDFEAGLNAAFDLYLTGQDPQDIWV